MKFVIQGLKYDTDKMKKIANVNCGEVKKEIGF